MVVAGDLTVEDHSARQGDHTRMKEEDRLDQLLKEVGRIVPPLNVSQFVPKHRIEFPGR